MTIQPVPPLDELAEAEALFASVHRSLAELNHSVKDGVTAVGDGCALSKSGANST